MAKAKSKKRPSEYEKPLKISGTFGDVIRVAAGKPPQPQEDSKKKETKKKKK